LDQTSGPQSLHIRFIDRRTCSSEHDRSAPQRSVSTTVTLPEASNDTLALVAAACQGVRSVWRDGYRYSKAGVITVDLVPLEIAANGRCPASVNWIEFGVAR